MRIKEGFTIKVTPAGRCHEVLHYLTTGALLNGKSLDGVVWREVEDKDAVKRANALARSMKACIK